MQSGPGDQQQPAADAWASRLAWGLLILGVAYRLYIYLLASPLWRDEAALALNFVGRDFRGLLGTLDNFQIAPVLFLWIEKAVYQYLGGSAALLRLVPLLAGIAGLILFDRLARRCLAPLPAALAVGCLAVAPTPVHLASTVKPYSLDLLVAVLLLILAVGYLQAPGRIRCLAALALVIPLAIALSFPAVFVAGAVGLVLSPVVWRQGGRAARGWFVVFLVLCAGTFLAQLRFVGGASSDPESIALRDYMATFWKDAFLPRQPLRALHWFVRCHVGHMLSYPVAFNGGGLLGLMLAVLGGRVLWRQRQHHLLGLCLLPFVLNFVAGALQRYPYAGDQRLEQHLLPGLCFLLGCGTAALIRWLSAGEATLKRWATVAAGLLVLTALAESVRATLQPYHDEEAAWACDIARHLRRELRSPDRILVSQPQRLALPCLRWQLLPFARQVGFATPIDWGQLKRSGGRLWLVDARVDLASSPEEPARQESEEMMLGWVPSGWRAVHHWRFLAREPRPGEEQVYRYCCDLYLYEGGDWYHSFDRAGLNRRLR
jgi:hypothetical protein